VRALCLLRPAAHYRKNAFCAGLRAAGYDVVDCIERPAPDDVLVIWNRYGWFDRQARLFENAGARVLVTENGYLGKDWLGDAWYALALGHHAGAGTWREGGPERWDNLDVEIGPWRNGTGAPLVLGQRGIGEPGIASPPRWAENMTRRINGRIRAHPGTQSCRPLDLDLSESSCVVTWASGAALKALLFGVPVWYEMLRWIGGAGGAHLSRFASTPILGDRLAMFRRLAWAMWRVDEIESGAAFRWILK
jgi:hypothetical protein